MMKLIIAEKPSVARTIAEALSTHVVIRKTGMKQVNGQYHLP